MLKRFVLMTPPVVVLGLALACTSRVARPLALGALGWVALVALMSQAGFSGEERYLLPAAAAAAVAAGVAWAGRLRALWLVVFAVLALAPLPFVAREAAELRRDLADDAALRTDLETAIAAAGGAERLRCGAVAAGRYRFPLVAWHLDVPISAVGFSLDGRDGTLLRSRLRRGEQIAPDRPTEGLVAARAGSWELWSTCEP